MVLLFKMKSKYLMKTNLNEKIEVFYFRNNKIESRDDKDEYSDIRVLVLDDLISMEITEEENEDLIMRPSELDLKKAPKSIPKDSSPGFEGFSSGFFIACWEITKANLLDAAQDFFSR